MKHRNGGKIRGGHTSLIDLADRVIGLIEPLPEVTGYSPGMLSLGKAHGSNKVKISTFDGGLVLSVRQTASIQEVRVYGPDIAKARFAIACRLRDNDIAIGFGKS